MCRVLAAHSPYQESDVEVGFERDELVPGGYDRSDLGEGVLEVSCREQEA